MNPCDLPIHSRTGLRAAGIVGGRPVWPILGGSEPPAEPPAPTPPAGAPPASPPPPADPPVPPAGDRGYPADTPVSEMTAEQAANYWRTQARKHETTVKKRGDYDQLKADSAELARLRQQTESDTQRATREAADQARTEVRTEMGERLVLAEFRAAAGGRIAADRLATLTEDLDLRRYLDSAGDVDAERVAAKVAAWMPDPAAPTQPARPKPDPTQGPRGTKPSGTAAGRDMFAARRRRTPAGTTGAT